MYNSTQARTAIVKKIQEFLGVESSKIQWMNQSDFKPPKDSLWCRVNIQYSPSVASGIHFGQLERDYGIISIQCFDKKGFGDDRITSLIDDWREHFKGWTSEYLQVYQTHAPSPLYSDVNDNYFGYVLRIDFRVN